MQKRPELLWKKESTKSNALYIDIFAGVRNMEVCSVINEENSKQKSRYLPKKDNKLSLLYRNQGNQLYTLKNYKKAIELYNKSLCYAEVDSEHVGFAFGNRSLCFLELKKYEQCLADIQLAKDANYPQTMMYKLDARKTACLEKIKTDRKPQPNQPKLSFDGDSQLPSMANILKIKQDDQFGRHIVTESDIEMAQTVIIERPLSDVLIGSEYSRCMNCLKENKNLIACKKCVNALFCDENCENNPYHRYECDFFQLFAWETDGFFRNMLQFVVRLVLVGVSLTPSMNIDEMMQLVANCVDANGVNEIAIANETVRSKYETLLKLSCFISSENELYDASVQMACLAYDLLLECKEIKQIFSTLPYQRFLMHLTFYFGGIFKTNRMTLAEINKFTFMSETVEHFGLAIYNIRSYLNHSCVPNVICLSYDNVLVCKAIKPIKKGEQLFIDYLDSEIDTTKTIRRGQLRDVYGFECNCRLCLLNTETLTSNPLTKADSDFVFVKRHFNGAMVALNENMLKNLKEKSIKFLKKWGRMKPCRELYLVQQYFPAILQILKDH